MKLRLASLLLAGCATHGASKEPLRYPPMPPKSSGSTVAPAFVASSDLTTFTLACRPAESAAPNALDDDCDGGIDGTKVDELVVALAYPRAAALRISLRGSDGAEAATASPCAEHEAVCIVRFAASSLPHGQYELSIESSEASRAALPSAVAVSAGVGGKVQTYSARVETAGETKRLGQLLNP